MNLLEQAIAYVAPRLALAREAARFRLDRLQDFRKERGYEGAAWGRRTQHWKASSRDANAEIAPSLVLLRNRSRDLRRNNPYAEAAIGSIIDNAIGYGIKPKPKGRTATLTKRAAQAWKDHAETTGVDYDGVHDIYGLEALAMGTIAESGAVLVRRRLLTTTQTTEKGLTLPFQVQVLEPDFIDLTRDGPQPDGSMDIKGVRFESAGGVRGYWLYDAHPGSAGLRLSAISSFVPARDVLHIFRVDRPGQVHGVPWAAPAMLRMRNFDEVEDAYIEREKIAACFAVFFSGMEGDGPTKVQLSERLEPGMMQFLPNGAQAQFATPPVVNGYKDFSSINLHAIAAGFGVPYEELVGDLAGVNFSSGRMGYQKYARRIERWQWQMFIPGFCSGIWSWFNASLRFAGLTQEDVTATWVPPRRMMVNPKEEIAAMKDSVRNGFETWESAVTSQGYDPDDQLAEIAATNEKLDAAGVKLDCDPRFALPAGSAANTADNDTGSLRTDGA